MSRSDMTTVEMSVNRKLSPDEWLRREEAVAKLATDSGVPVLDVGIGQRLLAASGLSAKVLSYALAAGAFGVRDGFHSGTVGGVRWYGRKHGRIFDAGTREDQVELAPCWADLCAALDAANRKDEGGPEG